MTSSEQIIARHWSELLSSASPAARQMLSNIAGQQSGVLSRLFYTSLLQDPQANQLLSSDEVETRLSASLERWIVGILTTEPNEDLTPLIMQQRHIGMMHSRVNVTIELVLRGARLIKNALMSALLHGPDAGAVNKEAAMLGVALVDIAIEAMSASYSASREKAARADQAFRSYAATVNVSLEREKQRASLFDWSNKLFQDLMIGHVEASLPRIGQSPFGFWIRHKAPALFNESEGLEDILFRIDNIDKLLLPACERDTSRTSDETRRNTRAIVAEVDQIRTILDTLFEHLVHLETGRDTQTQLLNRRFLSTVLSREIEISRNSGGEFSVLMLDVDHFKSVNDRYGHDSGDKVIEKVSQILSSHARSGDFAFRYGGEEFLLVCVEQSAQQALRLAEMIRKDVASQAVNLPNQAALNVTVSVGVAGHDGHPDYQRLVNRADEALYQAKNGGRNQCVLAA